jgi:transcription initiation factor TFIIIB Brf1 subunit/transcription initiation factor TFIIB
MAKSEELRAALQEVDRLIADSEMPDARRKSLLSAMQERCRLLNLYEWAKRAEQENEAEQAELAELSEIRRHLAPLGLAPEGTPLAELARLAALKITEK